jgi:hypothetical protein
MLSGKIESIPELGVYVALLGVLVTVVQIAAAAKCVDSKLWAEELYWSQAGFITRCRNDLCFVFGLERVKDKMSLVFVHESSTCCIVMEEDSFEDCELPLLRYPDFIPSPSNMIGSSMNISLSTVSHHECEYSQSSRS